MYTNSLIPHSSTAVMFVLYCSYWCYSRSADNELGVLCKGHCPVAVHWAETVPALGSSCSSAGELLCDSDVLICMRSATLKLLKMCICRDKTEIFVYLCLHSCLYNL